MALPITGHAHQAQVGADFVWFIYGSSLDRAAFKAWAGEHGYQVPDLARATPARLEGWRLSFDVASRYWGGAVGSLLPSPGDSVEGLALPVPAEVRGLADHKEGAISGLYEAREVAVTPLAGGPKVAAMAWVAAPDRRLPREQPPSVAWLETVIRGARAAGLSAGWLERLEGLRP
jgi:gamma-glutamylcyclotransferase